MIELTNGVIVPLHWNDRYYEATCPKCNAEVMEKTPTQVKDVLDNHC